MADRPRSRSAAARRLLGVAVVSAGLLAAGCTDRHRSNAAPRCSKVDTLVLMAQSVPTAELVPCIAALPAGWDFGEMDIRSGESTFTLDSDRAGLSAVRVTIARTCDGARGSPAALEEDESAIEGEIRKFEKVDSLIGGFRGTSSYLFPGGCVTYDVRFAQRGTVADVKQALGFTTRDDLDAAIRASSGGRLHL